MFQVLAYSKLCPKKMVKVGVSTFFSLKGITLPGGINFPSRPRRVDVKREFRWVELTALRSSVKASYISYVFARDHEKLFFVIIDTCSKSWNVYLRTQLELSDWRTKIQVHTYLVWCKQIVSLMIVSVEES